MDKLWKSAGLDMHLSPYGCISTGDELGMLEIVGNSDTLANIIISASDLDTDAMKGSAAKKIAAMRDGLTNYDIHYEWLNLNNIDALNSQRQDPPLFDARGNQRTRRN